MVSSFRFGLLFEIFDFFLLIIGQVQLVLNEWRNDVKTAGLHAAGTAACLRPGRCPPSPASAGRLIVGLSLQEARRCAECQRD